MKQLGILLMIALAACETKPLLAESHGKKKTPNIIIFYADDLGYGDVGSYGAVGVATPNVDYLANYGVRFIDAHASSAVCTPSRYSLLTGEYGFRSNAGILPGDGASLIAADKSTLPKMLQSAGYKTAVVGKWHLGLGDGNIDWNANISPGPTEAGFDYSFVMPATGDRVPTVYVENQRTVGLDEEDPLTVSYVQKIGRRPTGMQNPDLRRMAADHQHNKTIINGVPRIGYMAGGTNAEWIDEDFAEIFTSRAISFMTASRGQPFFLYFPFHDPHVPRLPHPQFQGATSMGPRGDAIVQMDWMVGEILAELESQEISEETLVIFTSDNGPVLNDGYEDGAVEMLGDHMPTGPFRGGKYSAFEAGSRVPTIAYWPGHIEPGTSDALLSQVDLFASLSELVDIKLTPNEAVDSEYMLEAWLGESKEGRQILFRESVTSDVLRHGPFKYISPTPQGAIGGTFIARKGIESGASKEPQLFDLSADLGERSNMASDFPERVNAMQEGIEDIRRRERAVRPDKEGVHR